MTHVLPKETILWLLKSTFFTILTLFFIQNSKAQTNSAATGSISGMVWVDENENTYKEDTEVGMGGVQVELYKELLLLYTFKTPAFRLKAGVHTYARRKLRKRVR